MPWDIAPSVAARYWSWMQHKPKKIERRHIVWLVLLLAAGSLPWLASIGTRRGNGGFEKVPAGSSS